MLDSYLFGALIAAAAVEAAQPGAVKPVAAPMRDLTWGQLNFLHTTDTHAWLSGHFLEPSFSADWGDYISFSQHMRKLADDKGADLLLIDTGDRIEGSGIYDGSVPKGIYQYDIYAQQKVDLLSTGNHELYKAYSVDMEHNTTVPNFKENYIASNLDYIDPKTGKRVPQAQRYRKFKTKNLGLNIVAFGFLFDFTGNANNSIVQPVADTIKEDWFQAAIKEKPDLFVVIGHVGVRMQEFKDIFTAIRKEDWDTPIAFFGGHLHIRDAVSYDSKSLAIASGRYLETIGWMSVDGIAKKQPKEEDGEEVAAQKGVTFSRKYIDNNLYGMYYHTGLNETTFPTKEGKKASQMIEDARKALDLDHRYGCAPRDLWMTRAPYPGKDSIYSWLEEEVLPSVVVNEDRKDKPRLAILNTGGIRFDIFKGPFTRDDTFTVSPFNSGFRYVADVPYEIAAKVIGILNSQAKIFVHGLPNTRQLTIPQQMYPRPNFDDQDEIETVEDGQDDVEAGEVSQEESETDEVFQDEDEEEIRLELRGADASSDNGELFGGYTTKDDIGKDGDDTVHKPIDFYAVPNCIQAEVGFSADAKPKAVDLVFIDFLLPWIIPALKFSGGDYSAKDVEPYMEGTLTTKLAEWISDNWKDEC
ncbi:Metallo-dependent phosphatase-like protein [Trichoderma gracile]